MEPEVKLARANLALTEFIHVSGDNYRDDIDNADEIMTDLINGLLLLAEDEKMGPMKIVGDAINKFNEERA